MLTRLVVLCASPTKDDSLFDLETQLARRHVAVRILRTSAEASPLKESERFLWRSSPALATAMMPNSRFPDTQQMHSNETVQFHEPLVCGNAT